MFRRTGFLFVVAGGISLLATDARAQCTPSLADGVNTRTCTGTITGQQQVRGGNTEEKLILQDAASITNNSGNGILGRDDSGAGTVTVQIDGGTVDASGSGINFDMGRSVNHPNGHSNVDINGGTINAGGTGVNINHRPASTGGRVTFDMSGGSIGLKNDRVATIGLSAGIQAPSNSQTMDIDMTVGSIYATERGMQLSHSGTGLIDVDIGSGATIDTSGTGNRGAGVFVSRSGPGGAIMIDNAGKITSAGHDGIYVINIATGATPITLNHTGTITAANNGIYVRQGSSATSGHGTVSVTSGGDITTTGPTGIFLDLTRGDATADDDVSVSLTGGTVKAMSTGIRATSRTLGRLTFGMTDGMVGTEAAPIGQTGVSLSLLNAGNTNDLDVDLTSGSIYAIWRGLSLSHAGTGNIDIDLGTGSRITTRENSLNVGDRILTRGAGVYASHSRTGAIDIDHAGTINSGTGTGIYAQHNGTGPLTVTNTGSITAGFQGIDARRFGSGTLSVTHRGGTITASQGPGIFIRHDAPRTANKYDVNVNIQGDVTTTSPGQAAVRADTRGPTANAGVAILHESGTLTGFGGIFATDARFTGSTHGTWPGPAPAPLAYDLRHDPKVLISVGRDATITASGSAAPATGLSEVDRLTRSLVGTNPVPRGITVGGGDYVLVGRFIAEGDGELALTLQERAVVNAVYGDGDLDAALNALPTDNPMHYTDVYKNTVRWYAGAYNAADYNVDVEGKITSTGDGIRIVRRHVHDRNGIARVTIHESGNVIAHRYGVRLRGAGMDGSGVRNQHVGVFGNLKSTGSDGAAIALRGGGYVTIGAGTSLEAASGTTIRVDDPDPVSAAHPASCESHEATGGVCPDNYDRRGGANLVVEIQQGTDEAIGTTLSRAVPGRIVNSGATRALVVNGNNVSLVPIRFAAVPVTPQPPPTCPAGQIGTYPNCQMPDPVVPVDPTDPVDPVDPVDPDTTTDPGGTGGGGSGGGGPTVPRAPIPSADDTDAPTWLTLTGEPPHPHDRMVSGAYGVWMDCDDAACILRNVLEPRSRVFAALPSILLDMNDVPSQGRFIHRDRIGTWGGTIAFSAERDLKDADTSYGLTRKGLILGHDFRTSEDSTLGLSVHSQAGAAAIDHGGEIDTMATGVSVAHRWDLAPLALGLNASTSSFSSDLTSSLRGPLTTGLSGTGYAVGIKAGVTLPDTVLTLGLTHKAVQADGFTAVLRDPNAPGGTAAVRVTDVRGKETMLRLSADYRKPITAGTLFVGAGLELPLDSRAEARVGNTHLSSGNRAGAHLQGGIAFGRDRGSGAILSLGYATTGDDNSVRADLTVRF